MGLKLDHDLFRQLLLWSEENLPRTSGDLEFPVLPPWSQDEVCYACLMATEAGFLVSIDIQELGSPFEQCIPMRLTYNGHQYLDTVRDEKIWMKTKEGAKKIGSFSIETLGQIAKAIVKVQLKKLTELDIEC